MHQKISWCNLSLSPSPDSSTLALPPSSSRPQRLPARRAWRGGAPWHGAPATAGAVAVAHARSPRATSCSRSAGTHGGAAAWHWRREPPRHRRQASPVAADAGALRRGFLLPLRVCSCPRRNPSCLCSTTAPVRVASSSPEAMAAAQLGGVVRRYVVLFSSSLSWLLLGSLERSGPGRGRRPRMHVAALGVRCIGAARASVPRCRRRAMPVAVGAGRPPLSPRSLLHAVRAAPLRSVGLLSLSLSNAFSLSLLTLCSESNGWVHWTWGEKTDTVKLVN